MPVPAMDFSQTSDGIHYISYMSRRIAFALEFKRRNGFVPEESELDEMVPIPGILTDVKRIDACNRSYIHRHRLKEVAYGLFGVSFFRGKFVGRVDHGHGQNCKAFDSCVDAAIWRNNLEQQVRGRFAVYCCLFAAQLVDDGIIDWEHVVALKRGYERPIPYIQHRLTEMQTNDPNQSRRSKPVSR